MLYKISCQHCGGHISFEKNALGATINCPHCQQWITLVAPLTLQTPEQTGEAETAQAPAAAPEGPTPGRRRKFPLLQPRWLTLAGLILFFGVLARGIVWFWPRSAEKPALPPDEQLTVGLVSFKPDKVILSNTTQFQVTLHKDFSVSTIYLCDVTFLEQKPSPGEIDKIVRDSLEKCVKADGTQEILAMAFLKGTALHPPDYSGPLVWKPEEKTIKPIRNEQ